MDLPSPRRAGVPGAAAAAVPAATGSLAGAFIASLLIGLLQSYAIASDVGMPDLLNLLGVSFERGHPLNDLWTMNLPQIAPVLPYLLLVLVLIFRPTGLMGKREE